MGYDRVNCIELACYMNYGCYGPYRVLLARAVCYRLLWGKLVCYDVLWEKSEFADLNEERDNKFISKRTRDRVQRR